MPPFCCLLNATSQISKDWAQWEDLGGSSDCHTLQIGKGCQARETQSIHNHHLHPPRGEKLQHSYHNCVNAHVTHKSHSFEDLKVRSQKYMWLFTQRAPLPLRCYLTEARVKQAYDELVPSMLTGEGMPWPLHDGGQWLRSFARQRPVAAWPINISTEVLQTQLPPLPAKYQYVISFLLYSMASRTRTM